MLRHSGWWITCKIISTSLRTVDSTTQRKSRAWTSAAGSLNEYYQMSRSMLMCTTRDGSGKLVPLSRRRLEYCGTRRNCSNSSARAGLRCKLIGFTRLSGGAAAELWKIEHFRAAVARAATFLNAHIQDKSTRTDVSDKELMTQVFSDHAPKADQPRLRWSGAGSLQTRKAMGSGLLAYAQGISLAIRNPATHETQEMPRQMAFEQLTALSLLARWVDECQLAQAEDGA